MVPIVSCSHTLRHCNTIFLWLELVSTTSIPRTGVWHVILILWRICSKQTVMPQKPRNTHVAIEVRMFTTHCWVTHITMGLLLSVPQPLLRIDSINTFQQYRQSFLYGWRRDYITSMKPVPVQ
jgi:hypothetical protein